MATKTGWAINGQYGFFSGCWDLSLQKGEEKGQRLARLWRHITVSHRQFRFQRVVAERSGTKFGHANRVLPYLEGSAELWCALNDIPITFYSPSDVKMHATGKGNADKQAMIEAAYARWPKMRYVDDNQIDACWMLDLALRDLKT